MPNALDDAMMMSYNWNKGMDERLKKIKETFTPAEIDEGIEFMFWRRKDKENSLKMLKPLREDEGSEIKEMINGKLDEIRKVIKDKKGQTAQQEDPISKAARSLRYAVEMEDWEKADSYQNELNSLLEKRKVGDLP